MQFEFTDMQAQFITTMIVGQIAQFRAQAKEIAAIGTDRAKGGAIVYESTAEILESIIAQAKQIKQ